MSIKLLRNFISFSCVFLLTALALQAKDHEKEAKPFGLVSKLTQDTEIIFGLTHFEEFANEIGKSNFHPKSSN